MVSFLIASLLIAEKQTLSFPGGSASELCQILSEQSKCSVVSVVYDEKPLKAFSFKWYEQKDLDRLLWPMGKQHLVRSESGLGLYKGGLTSNIVDNNPKYVENLKIFKIPEGANRDGVITVQTGKGESLTLRQMSRLRLSKDLDIHWLYQKIGFAVSAKNVTEKQLLSTIAAAIGAKFSETSGSYKFDFDPSSYRMRLVESLSGPRPVGYSNYRWGVQYSKAVNRICMEAVKAISNPQLEKCFETPNGSVDLDVPPRSALFEAGMDKVDAVEEASREKDPNFRQMADAYKIMLASIDTTKEMKVVFGTPAQCGVMFRTLANPNTWMVL